MSCRIERDQEGKILKVYDPKGQESTLYKELLSVPGNTPESALEQYISTIDETSIEFKRTPINNGLTSHMFVMGDDKIGTIRTKPYKDGVKVDQALVTEGYRGQGIGTELYLETIRNLMIEGKKLYSDSSRTAPAEAIWKKLVGMNLAIQNEDGTYETVSPVGIVTEETTIDEIIESLSTDNSVQLKEIGDRLIQNSVVKDFHLLSNEEIVAELVKRGINEDLARQVVAYHGSPHRFDRFSTDYIGTGEGAQAFGWGLYFADLENIAKNYATEVKKSPKYVEASVDRSTLREGTKALIKEYYSDSRDLMEAIRLINFYRNEATEENKVYYDEAIPFLKRLYSEDTNLYNVTLHKGKQPSEYTWLEWDKTVNSNLLSKIKNDFKKQRDNFKRTENYNQSDKYLREYYDELLKKIEAVNMSNNSDLYKRLSVLFGSDKGASLFLLENGIDGIKYPAESVSRGATSDNARGFNYVVFDENAVTIEEVTQFQKELSEKGVGLTTAGFYHNGEVFINKEVATSNTVIHEFAHPYITQLKERNPEMYAEGIQKLQEEGQDIIDWVKERQPNLTGEALLEEALVQAVGNEGESLLNDSKHKGLKAWIQEFWNDLKTMLGLSNYSTEVVKEMTLKEYSEALAVDVMRGSYVGLDSTIEGLLDPPIMYQIVGEKGVKVNINRVKDKINKRNFIRLSTPELQVVDVISRYTDISISNAPTYEELNTFLFNIEQRDILEKLPYNLILEDHNITRENIENVISKFERKFDKLDGELYSAEKVLENLKVAQEMTSEGKTPTEVRLSTGWELAPDGKWRYEISDFETKGIEIKLDQELPNFKNKVGKYKLRDLLKNSKDLFSHYPSLKDTEVIFVNEEFGNFNMAVSEGKIYIDYEKYTRDNRFSDNSRVLSHEVQHLIQDIEGFARGGSLPEFYPSITEFINQVREGTYNRESEDSRNGVLLRDVQEVFEERIKEEDREVATILFGQRELDIIAFGLYQRLYGEVEARNVQNRYGLTNTEKLNTLLSERELDPIKDNQTIIKFDEDSVQYKVGEVQTESYKEAVELAQGQDIEVGTIVNGQFQPTEVRSSSLNPTNRIGWINNAVAEGIVKEKQFVEDGVAKLEVEGVDPTVRVANEQVVKEFALENNMKAEITEEGTFELKSLEVQEDFKDKVVYDKVYDVFFGDRVSETVFMETDSQLSQKIVSFLEKAGLSLTSIENYKKNYKIKHGVEPNAEALIDLSNQVIAFREGRITEEALTEEFVHLVLEGLPIEELQPLLDRIHESKEWADHSETYMRVYKNDEALVRKEILGKAIANRLQTKGIQEGFFAQAWAKIKDFLNRIIKPGLSSELDGLTDRVHDLLVRQDTSGLEDLSKRKFRLYRIDNTLPDLVETAVKQIEEGEKQLRNSGSDKYLIAEAYRNIEKGRERLAVVNMLDLAKRQARYVSNALDTSEMNNTLLSGEERVVANNLKNVVQPIISRIRTEANRNPELMDLVEYAKEVSDDISMLDVSVSQEVADGIIDEVFRSDPNLETQEVDGMSMRDFFRKAFKVAESDTNFLFSMIGSIAHAKDALLGMLTKVLKNMTMRAQFNFHNDAMEFNRVLREANILPKDLKKFYHKDGFMISYWDWAEHNRKLNEAKADILKSLGVDLGDGYDPSKRYLDELSEEDKAKYQEELTKRRKEFEHRKFNEEFYKKMNDKMESLNLSPESVERINAFMLERSHIMKGVKRDSKNRPIFTRRDIEALEAYNIERKRVKSFYDSEGLLKRGIEAHMEEVPDSVMVGGMYYTLDKGASEEAIIAFEMVKYDNANRPTTSHRGVTQFLDMLRGMSLDQAKAFVKANININPVYKEFEPEVVPPGKEIAYEVYKKLIAQRRALLNRYRDPKNSTNILFHQIDKSTQAKIRELTELISVQRKLIDFKYDSESEVTTEFGPNEAYKNWVKEEGLAVNPKEHLDRALEHVPLHQRAYLTSLFTTIDLLSRKYAVSKLELNRLKKEFEDVDFTDESLTEEDILIIKLSAVEKRLAPYFMAHTPIGMSSSLDSLDRSSTVEDIINKLEEMDQNPDLALSMHYSFYEDNSADLNPEYNQSYKGGAVQPKDVNPEFDKVLGLTPGTYTLDDYGVPVMKVGYPETAELKVYRSLIMMKYKSLELQNEAGNVNLFQAPQVSKTSTDKIMSVLGGSSGLVETASEYIRELKQFRIDDLAIGEVDKNGEALMKQGIRVVPRRFIRPLENASDVTDDLFYSMLLMNKESHLHKARKESLSQVLVLEQAANNRKYNNTNKQAQSTNTAKMMKSFIDNNVFGISEVANYKVNLPFVGAVDLAKLSKILHKYVRDRNLAYNLIVPMTSWLTAEVGLMIEGWVNQYIDKGSVSAARKELARLTPKAMTEALDIVKESKLSMIAERFDFFNMEQSYQNAKYGKGVRTLGKLGYIAHTAGNYSPIMTAMLSSLIGHRLYAGRFVDFEEFKTQVRASRDLSSKEVLSEWNALERNSFYDYIEAGDGKYQLLYDKFSKDTGIDISEAKSILDTAEIDISIKTQKISEIIDGNIRPEERSIAQRHFLLSFLTTHKGWMSIALARRFKEGHYNTSTKKWEEGHYMTAFKAAGELLKNVVKAKGNPSKIKDQILKDWIDATPEQRVNMKRILIEMGTLSGLYLLYLMMVGFADDDENLDNSSIQFTAYIMERLVNETRSSQLGLGEEVLNTIQDPVVGFKELRKTFEISKLFDSEEVERGRYKGLSGTSSWLLNTIPGGKSMHTIWSGENINYQRRAYQFYNSPDDLQPLGLLIDSDDVNELFGN